MTKVNFNSVPIALGHFSGIYHLFFFEKAANAPRWCQRRIHTNNHTESNVNKFPTLETKQKLAHYET